jgi:hypothetical protein
MSAVQEINRAILSGNWTHDELNSMRQAIQFVNAQLTRKNVGQMVIGTQVEFTNSRNHQKLQGRVEKVGRKFVTVNTNLGRWRVPAAMLSRV